MASEVKHISIRGSKVTDFWVGGLQLSMKSIIKSKNSNGNEKKSQLTYNCYSGGKSTHMAKFELHYINILDLREHKNKGRGFPQLSESLSLWAFQIWMPDT